MFFSRQSFHRFAFQQLEERALLSTVGFADHEIVKADLDRPRSVYAADLDGDGDDDVLSASSDDGPIVWYENTDGTGTFGNRREIDARPTALASTYAVAAGDLDGDGDVDVLSASRGIGWYENIDGQGSFHARQHVTGTNGGFVHAADIDGDGDLDILSEGGGFGEDGDLSWFENTDGQGNFSIRHAVDRVGLYKGSISSSFPSVYTADFDGDGDLDVVSATPTVGDYIGRTAWHENVDGKGTFGRSKTIVLGGSETVYAADLDGDGDMDAVTSSRLPHQKYAVTEKVSWVENIDGKGSFAERIITTDRAVHSLMVADFDGDGDADILAAYGNGSNRYNGVSWFENTENQERFIKRQVLTESVRGRGGLFVADIDGDGDRDALSASSHDKKIAWYENSDGAGTFGPQQVINTTLSFPSSVGEADFDSDGDIDVLSASSGDDKIAWYENTHGQGVFGIQRMCKGFCLHFPRISMATLMSSRLQSTTATTVEYRGLKMSMVEVHSAGRELSPIWAFPLDWCQRSI